MMISKHIDKTIININKYNFMGRFTDLAHSRYETQVSWNWDSRKGSEANEEDTLKTYA